MRFTALFAMSSCAGLFLTEQCKPASEPAKQDFRQGAVEIAPHPRDRFTHTVSRGFVTSIEKTHIKVQGFDFHIKDSNHMEIIAVGRTLAEVKTGPALTISGSFPTLTGVRTVTDRRTYLAVTHADGSNTEIRICEQPHRKYWLSDVLRAGYPGTGGRGNLASTYRISDLQVGDEISMNVVDNLYDHPVCEAILICARPGGRVPPAPGELERQKERPSNRPLWHERANATQDWEEKGIPLPYQFHPGRSTGYPIHPGGSWPQLAPPPREVKR